MHTRSISILIALLGGSLCAQNAPFTLVPSNVEKVAFRTSPNVPNTLLTRVDAEAFRGVCQTQVGNTVLGRMTGFGFEMEDGNGATAPLLTFVVRQAATTADVFSLSFRLPPAEAESIRYSVTAALGTPFDGIPKDQTFHFGVQVPFTSSMADQVKILAAPNATAPAKPNAPRVCFSVEPFVGLIPLDVTLAMRLTTDGPALVPAAVINGAGTIVRGRSGMYPDRMAGFGLAFAIDAGRGRAHRPYFVLGGAPFGFASPLSVPGFGGELHVLMPFLPDVAAMGVLNAAGRATVPSPLLGYGFTTYTGSLYFQALIGGAELELTNAVSTNDL
ncbi:MAG: hypothetical protein ACO3RU_00800 [Planctomycetota bacterium]